MALAVLKTLLIGFALVVSGTEAQAVMAGVAAKTSDFRSTVFVNNLKTSQTCTGVLIHERILLTAGHCTSVADGHSLSFSTKRVIDSNQIKLSVERILTSPGYSRAFNGTQTLAGSGSDLGIIVFSQSVLSKLDLRSSDLPKLLTGSGSLEPHLAIPRNYELAGYGWTTLEGTERPEKRLLTMSLVGRSSRTVLELKSPKKKSTACFGDSGGGLFTREGGVDTLIGTLTSITPGGALRKRMDQKLAERHASKPGERVSLSQLFLKRVCGDADTVQHFTTLASHVCWIQSATGITLDANRDCSSR